MQVLFAGLRNKAVDETEVILAFSRFDELPGYGRQDSVEGNGGEAGPNRFYVFQAGGTGIVKFGGEHQEGLAGGDQPGGNNPAFPVRPGPRLAPGPRPGGQDTLERE